MMMTMTTNKSYLFLVGWGGECETLPAFLIYSPNI